MKIADYSLKNYIGHLTDKTIYKKVHEKMRNCSVTVVLIVDIEDGLTGKFGLPIEVSHPTPLKSFKPKGLLAIYLLTYSHFVPDRQADNIKSGYAVSMKWENLERDLKAR